MTDLSHSTQVKLVMAVFLIFAGGVVMLGLSAPADTPPKKKKQYAIAGTFMVMPFIALLIWAAANQG